jgi:hypothetical protein
MTKQYRTIYITTNSTYNSGNILRKERCNGIFYCYDTIQGESGGNANILGGDSIGHCEKKKSHMNNCVILNGYRDRAV